MKRQEPGERMHHSLMTRRQLLEKTSRPQARLQPIAHLLLALLLIAQLDRLGAQHQAPDWDEPMAPSADAEPVAGRDAEQATKLFRLSHLGLGSRQRLRPLKLRSIGNENGSNNGNSTQSDQTTTEPTTPTTTTTSTTTPKIKKINSAALKKLLSRTMPKYGANGTSLAPKSPNFKLVFIQRAAASNATGKRPEPAPATSGGQHQPLAGSVSRQLASSLLNSAANLLQPTRSSTNLTSAFLAPSVASSLAHQQVALTTTSRPVSGAPGEQLASGIKRTNQPGASLSKAREPTATTTTTTATAAKQVGAGKRRKQPSKIYNLPVKFISNGQPNNVMLRTMKQHFATIKRLQSTPLHSGDSAKRKKFDGSRLKGTNSRLIYLPLRYLSNARPHKLMVTKASHKSVTMVA